MVNLEVNLETRWHTGRISRAFPGVHPGETFHGPTVDTRTRQACCAVDTRTRQACSAATKSLGPIAESNVNVSVAGSKTLAGCFHVTKTNGCWDRS